MLHFTYSNIFNIILHIKSFLSEKNYIFICFTYLINFSLGKNRILDDESNILDDVQN